MDAPVHIPPDTAGLLERLLDEAEREAGEQPSAAVAASPSAPAPPPPMPPLSPPMGGELSGLLGGLLGNPAMMAALPSLLENIGPLLGGGGAPNGDGVGRDKRAPGAGGRRPGPPTDRHTALLCAVKPYLSHERQEAAETVLRLCRIWDALAKSGVTFGSLGALLSPTGAASSATPVSATDTAKEVT